MKQPQSAVRRVARALRDFLQNTKNSLRLPTPWLAAKRRGDITKRIADFSLLFDQAPGSSLLDIGCYDGLIAYEFVRHGARSVVGIDNDPYHLATARRIFTQVALPSRFVHADLRKQGALARALREDDRTSFDIVLFLGVFQHIFRDMSSEKRASLVRAVCDRTGRVLAVRMPAPVWTEFEQHFPASEFEELLRIPQAGTVGEMRLWRRRVLA